MSFSLVREQFSGQWAESFAHSTKKRQMVALIREQNSGKGRRKRDPD